MKYSAGAITLLVVAGVLISTDLTGRPAHAQRPGSSQDGIEQLEVPLPDRNPLRASGTGEPEAPPHPSKVEAPEWTAQDIQAAQDKCAMMLDGLGFAYRHLDPLREGVCGTPSPIELSSVGANPAVAIEPPARVTCELAASLGAWADGFLQPAAQKQLGESITVIRNVASYVCRNRYNAADKPISEHARANALDMAAFRTVSGKWITVLDNWALPQPPEAAELADEEISGVTSTAPPTGPLQENKTLPTEETSAESETESYREPEPRPETSFLRAVHASACELFGTVLGPEANEAHKDHFHFDLAQRSHGNYCE